MSTKQRHTFNPLPFTFCMFLMVALGVVLIAPPQVRSGARGDWMTFSEYPAVNGRPLEHILHCKMDSIVLELTVPGMLVQDLEVGNQAFNKVTIPGEGWLDVVGKPMVPEVSLMIACPEFDDVNVSWEPSESRKLEGWRLYPCPEEAIEDGPEGPYVTTRFCIDENAYLTCPQ